MSCVFPGAGNIDAFWNNIINGVDAIQAVPEDRLDAVFFDADTPAADRFYCRRGGFIPEFEFDPLRYGLLPLAVEGMEPDQLLALNLARRALDDAGVPGKERALDKTGIIIGRGGYAGPGVTRAIEIVRTGEQIAALLRDLLPDLTGEEIDKVKKEFQAKRGRFGADTVGGLIPNLAASLVANRLNLGGSAYTIDAACASSLIAVDHAVQELSSGRCEMVLAGGLHICQNAAFWSVFTQLGALSRNQQIRPFDRRADGLLIGEGCGFVVLKRLDDAIRDRQRIYAVIKGTGVGSDGAGSSALNPAVKGQLKAITQAWKQAGLDPEGIGYIEAHGTATPVGDKTELETLAKAFGNNPSLPKAGIGTVKSMIGHAMPAAGIAGLIKTALALYHDKLPPTLHCEQPLDIMRQTRFEPVREAVDWEQTELPKRAGVNAFGFGGINAHVVLEGYRQPVVERKEQAPVVSLPQKDEVLLLARPSREALIEALRENEQEPGEGHYRIAVFNPTPARREKALRIVQKDLPWRNKQDMWYVKDPLISGGGKVAFLFPGLDALSAGETGSVSAYFRIKKAVYPEVRADSTLHTAYQALEGSRIMDMALKQLGVHPDINAGHSMGEWLAIRFSGMVTEDSVTELMQRLDPSAFTLHNARFLAVGCGYDKLEPMLRAVKDIYLSNDNCPQQVILCGTYAAIEKTKAILRKEQIFHQLLPFESGFHSPFIKDKAAQILEGMDTVKFSKGKIPVWSATTLEPYPDDYEAVKRLTVEHLIKPVRFRELTETLYQQGVRVFIQVGSGGLKGFIDDTLKGKTYSAVRSNVPSRSGLCQLQRVLAALFVEGGAVDRSFLGMTEPDSRPLQVMKPSLGLPLLTSFSSLKKGPRSVAGTPQPVKEPSLEDVPHPVVQAFRENSDEMARIQAEIVELFSKTSWTTPNPAIAGGTVPHPDELPPERRGISKQLVISLDTHPYIADHGLVRQKPGWHCAEDRDPVVPMTMILELFAETAREHAPGKAIRKIRHIQALQWMNISEGPFREVLEGEWKDSQTLSLSIKRYAHAEMVLAEERYELPPPPVLQLGAPLDVRITPRQVYEEYMFHGPAYQGIKELVVLAENGITGIIEGGGGKGSLLDNAGQLFGFWLMVTLKKDKVAFPVKIQAITFYGDMQDQRGRFECTCRLTSLNDEFATADIVLKRNGQVWATILGWQNRRLEMDERFWNVSTWPSQYILSEEVAPGVFMFHNAYQRMVTWHFIRKRYLNQTEKKYHSSLPASRQKPWLIGRIAVKDAVRTLLHRTRQETYYPVEFEIRTDVAGKPYTHSEMIKDIHISLAHKKTDAVGIARLDKPVGIDLEVIEDRGPEFNELVFTKGERDLIGSRDRAEWTTRCWVAKEAYGKYLGKGLQGNPRAYVVEEINGEMLRIKDIVIQTVKYHNYIIGWTK